MIVAVIPLNYDMTQFVRFQVDDHGRFNALQNVFAEIQVIKNLDYPLEPVESDTEPSNVDYDVDGLRALMPDDVQSNFIWPNVDELNEHKLPHDKPIAISPPGALLGADWSLVRILELIDCCEYSLDRCVMVDDTIAEMHVVTWSYPYGGLNALIALIEGFGCHIVGVDECGEFESRQEIERNRR